MQQKSTAEKSDRFISVIQANKGIIYKIANSYCKNDEDRKDLVQEIILQLWKAFDTYSEQYRYSTWIFRIALNVSISFYRKVSRQSQVYNELPDDILDIAETNDSFEKEEKTEALLLFISELKELDKALMLLYLEEKSTKEIAEIIWISESNVTTRTGRIKEILKQKFSNQKS